jgi:hypothetical protein
MLTLPVYRALVCAAGALLPGGSTPPSRTVARLAGEIRRTGSSPNDPTRRFRNMRQHTLQSHGAYFGA